MNYMSTVNSESKKFTVIVLAAYIRIVIILYYLIGKSCASNE